MKYPDLLREMLGRLPFTANISSRKRPLLTKALSLLFKERGHSHTVSVHGEDLTLDISRPGERIMYYLPQNLIRFYLCSDLYFLMANLGKRPGDVFFDIGANLGIYSLLAKKLGLRAYQFEPEPIHFSYLQRNGHVFANAYNCALSDKTGKADFYVSSARATGASSLVMSSRGWDNSVYDHKISVDTIPLDDFIKTIDLDLAAVKLIKIDVEGNELNTLLGMREVLAREHSPMVWCEVRGPGSDRGENNYIEIARYMRDFGYSPYVSSNKTVKPFREGEKRLRKVFDLLFASPEHCAGLGHIMAESGSKGAP